MITGIVLALICLGLGLKLAADCAGQPLFRGPESVLVQFCVVFTIIALADLALAFITRQAGIGYTPIGDFAVVMALLCVLPRLVHAGLRKRRAQGPREG
ncbi:MAG: hypothetical protein ACXIUZ_02460 [Lysobacteraceae bacterium]